MFFTYVIKNEHQKTYVGHTSNLQLRIDRHNGIEKSKKSSFTTKNTGEWFYIHVEGYNSREEAATRERQLKSSAGRRFIKELTT